MTANAIASDDDIVLRHVRADDGAAAELLCLPPAGEATGHLLYWLPAMGVPARHYLPLARALTDRGIGVALHEWRGIGSSALRASRGNDWGYRELLRHDLPAGLETAREQFPQARLVLGGHSLGGQLAMLFAALHPQRVEALALVASGAPYWRCFRPWGVPLWLGYGLARLLALLLGHYPGRRLGFGGNEARGVIADWSRSGRTGRYAARGLDEDLERRLAALRRPVLGIRLADDAFGPAASLRYLLDKAPAAPSETRVLDADSLDARADHFAWMKSPQAVAGRIAGWLHTGD